MWSTTLCHDQISLSPPDQSRITHGKTETLAFFFLLLLFFYTVDSLPRNLLLIVWDNQYWALIFSYRAPVLMTTAKVTPFVSFLRLKYSWDAKLCFFASKLIHFSCCFFFTLLTRYLETFCWLYEITSIELLSFHIEHQY